MHRIFLGLVIWGVLFLLAECAMGIAGHWTDAYRDVHFLLGVFLAIYLCLIHTAVMFHFIGSGKEMKEAMEVLGKDHAILAEIRRFKMWTSPLATFAMLITIAAEVFGGGVRAGAIAPWIHTLLVLFTVILNVWAFVMEYRCLKRNLELLVILDERYQLMQKQEKATHDQSQ